MTGRPISPRLKLGLSIASVVLMLVGYTVIAHVQHARNAEDTTIPTWDQLAGGVATALAANPRTGERWIVSDAWATLTRLFCGLVVGILGAVALGLWMGTSMAAEAFFTPPMSLLAKVPPTAALAVFFVMVGTGREMFVAMIAFGVLPTMAQSVHLAVKAVPDELLYKAQTLGASRGELVWNVVFRHTLPAIIDAIRLQIGPAMVYLIAAEMVVGDVGFGYRIRLQSRLLNMNVVYPYLALLAAFGFGVDYGLRRLQRAACPWHAA